MGVTLHTDRGMLIMSVEEINEFECGPMGSFPTPHRLCTWECPAPDEGSQFEFEMGPDTSAESDAAAAEAAAAAAEAEAADAADADAAAADAVDSSAEADATGDNAVDSTTAADVAAAAAEPSAAKVAPAAPSAMKTLGLTKRPKRVNPNAPAAVKAFRSKIAMALP